MITLLHLARKISLLLFIHIPIAVANPDLPEDIFEQQILTINQYLLDQQWEKAAELASSAEAMFPNNKLTALLKQSAMKKQIPSWQTPILVEPNQNEFINANLEAELFLRSQYAQHKPASTLAPNAIIKLNTTIDYALLVDMEWSRLYILKNTDDALLTIADYYIGIGKQGTNKLIENDHRTPIGVYKIVDYMPDKELDELYGVGAFPINYPNRWDKVQKKTGYGIWLHGVPRSTYSRPPRSSRGCVTISNHLLSAIADYITIGSTPIILANSIEWITPKTISNKYEEIMTFLEKWQQDWESLEFSRYIENYAEDFQSSKMNFIQWKKHKERINSRKEFISIELKNISAFNHPSGEDLFQINYRQTYKSNNFNASANKTLMLRKSANNVKIIYEGLQ